MIHGKIHNDTILKMRDSVHQFYLTGSRFFKCERADSDWDFFVQAGPGVEAWLKVHGFYKESDPDYLDALHTEVWRQGTDNVHVQVVKDAKLKRQAQDILIDFPWRSITDGAARKNIWNWAIKLAFDTNHDSRASLRY